MDKICAIVDTQGFQLKDRFIPREVAVVSDYISQCQELDPCIEWNTLTKDEQETIIYSTQFKHGLFYRPFNPDNYCFIYKSKDIGDVLQIWYDMIATDERPLFGYKNPQLGKILSDINIPCIDLDKDLHFPRYEFIQNKYNDSYLCAFHKKPRNWRNNKLVCALRKAGHLYREVKLNTQNMET
jgi:hypothetical protein